MRGRRSPGPPGFGALWVLIKYRFDGVHGSVRPAEP